MGGADDSYVETSGYAEAAGGGVGLRGLDDVAEGFAARDVVSGDAIVEDGLLGVFYSRSRGEQLRYE